MAIINYTFSPFT